MINSVKNTVQVGEKALCKIFIQSVPKKMHKEMIDLTWAFLSVFDFSKGENIFSKSSQIMV